MEAPYEIPSVSERNIEKHALAAVLASRRFTRTPRLSGLLQYLCERHFERTGEAVKEYTIATDVFGRPANFDQSTDAIVRVEVHRLRKRLKEFYADEGRNQEVEIGIQYGRYVPEFHYFPERAVPPAALVSEPLVTSPALPPPPEARSRGWSWMAAVAIVFVSGAILVGFPLWKNGSAPGADGNSVAYFGSGSNKVNGAVRILCGLSQAKHCDSQGNEWSADHFFTGGDALELPSHPIYRTRDQFLFRNGRSGDFSYRIPLGPGIYEMRLFFADRASDSAGALEGGENTRVFGVSMNNAVLLKPFDVIADAGPNTADVRVFKDVAAARDGFLHLDFNKVRDAAILNAIEIVPGNAHKLRPIRIFTGETGYTDRAGKVWAPDNYFLNGRTAGVSTTVKGAVDPEIYRTERYGNFSYAVPVAAGEYSVSLHFAPGDAGAHRVFDVECNGSTLLHEFDLSQSANHPQPTVKTFHGLHPNAQGKLLFSFIPVNGYAALSALEIVDETD